MVEPVVAEFPEGIAWQPGGQPGPFVPQPGTPDVHVHRPPVETRAAVLAVGVLEGGEVHLRIQLVGAPEMGTLTIPQAMLADVVAAMQAAAPVAEAEVRETRDERETREVREGQEARDRAAAR
jgi:hypothetical protein